MRLLARSLAVVGLTLAAAFALATAAFADSDAPPTEASSHGPLIAIGVVVAIVVVVAIFALRRMARRKARLAEEPTPDAPPHSDRSGPAEETLSDVRDGRYP